MSKKSSDFDVYLPGKDSEDVLTTPGAVPLRKFTARLNPGKSNYEIKHGLQTPHVIVQTSIAGNVREGGVSILNEDTVRIAFGGTLNEPIDVVIVG